MYCSAGFTHFHCINTASVYVSFSFLFVFITIFLNNIIPHYSSSSIPSLQIHSKTERIKPEENAFKKTTKKKNWLNKASSLFLPLACCPELCKVPQLQIAPNRQTKRSPGLVLPILCLPYSKCRKIQAGIHITDTATPLTSN